MTPGDGPSAGDHLKGEARLLWIRQRIDKLDRTIVGLLNERARLALEAGRTKTAAGEEIRDPDREREVLLRVAMANEGPLSQAALLEVYSAIMEAFCELEEQDPQVKVLRDEKPD